MFAFQDTPPPNSNAIIHEFNHERRELRNAISLIPVQCANGDTVTEDTSGRLSLQQMLEKERGDDADDIIVFAIRRPGCGNCREHGLQIQNMVRKLQSTTNDTTNTQIKVRAVGIIKEINVDNDALAYFYNTYYKYPIYKDEKWAIYKALLGDRKTSVWKLLFNVLKMNARYKEQDIINVPFGGDLFTEGGVLVFDKENNLRYIQHETYTELLNINELRNAILQAGETNNNYNNSKDQQPT